MESNTARNILKMTAAVTDKMAKTLVVLAICLGATIIILLEVQCVPNGQVPESCASVVLKTALFGLVCWAGWSFKCRKMAIRVAAFLVVSTAGTSSFAVSLGDIMPLGDSITYGSVAGGYRNALYSKLNTAGYSFAFVGSCAESTTTLLTGAGQTHHEGHPAIRLDEIEANLDGNTNYETGFGGSGNGGFWLSGTTTRPAVYPNVVLLMAGINDIGKGAAATVAQDRLDSLVNHIFADRPTTTVIVASLTPLTGDLASMWGARVDAYNAPHPQCRRKNTLRPEKRRTLWTCIAN